MANNTKRRVTPKKPYGKLPAPLVADEREEFGKRLYQALIDNDMSQSDLAREVFNETKTDPKTGYELVMGRDRISQYVKGRQFPDPRTFKKICHVLKMKEEELAPSKAASTIERDSPSLDLRVVGDRHDAALLRVNKIMPLKDAVAIVDIIEKAEKR